MPHPRQKRRAAKRKGLPTPVLPKCGVITGYKKQPCQNPGTDADGRCPKHPARWHGVSPDQHAFLEAFKLCGNIRKACAASGAFPRKVRRWVEEGQHFAELYEEAKQESADRLEETARKLATGKVRKYQFDKVGRPLRHPVTGEPYYEEVYDTGMLKFLHKIVRPEAHREQIDIRTLGINLTDLPDEALERLANGEDIFSVISDLLRRLKNYSIEVPGTPEIREVVPLQIMPGANGKKNGNGTGDAE